ncbi:ras-related and estrogen-regulated growth inhibitor-like protein [Sinocyclocheilus grahami]|uniref:ras-related and estrogen-regulated growth inhibitor-like protein n=1 Tax=Sinocyclocheilus grahami TaxID=75366 RepID=UPI0007ACC771|nr:PREDICTED: ras-related and estrogen-regulated growth inhibitor-like protein [Sinocyclocheilus grahami]
MVVKLKKSFQQQLNESFGKSLHASLLNQSSSKEPSRTPETEAEREKHRNTLKRMREFFTSCETTESISDKQMQWADGVILVYSICDRSSFEVVRQQVQLIRQTRKLSASTPIIIVGNKRDLLHQRAVSSEEGRLFALSADCGFFEISAAETYHGVLLVFHEILNLIKESKALKKGMVGIKGIVRSVSAVFGKKRELFQKIERC